MKLVLSFFLIGYLLNSPIYAQSGDTLEFFLPDKYNWLTPNLDAYGFEPMGYADTRNELINREYYDLSRIFMEYTGTQGLTEYSQDGSNLQFAPGQCPMNANWFTYGLWGSKSVGRVIRGEKDYVPDEGFWRAIGHTGGVNPVEEILEMEHESRNIIGLTNYIIAKEMITVAELFKQAFINPPAPRTFSEAESLRPMMREYLISSLAVVDAELPQLNITTTTEDEVDDLLDGLFGLVKAHFTDCTNFKKYDGSNFISYESATPESICCKEKANHIAYANLKMVHHEQKRIQTPLRDALHYPDLAGPILTEYDLDFAYGCPDNPTNVASDFREAMALTEDISRVFTHASMRNTMMGDRNYGYAFRAIMGEQGDPDSPTYEGSGVQNWTDLEGRMRFIASLFRSTQVYVPPIYEVPQANGAAARVVPLIDNRSDLVGRRDDVQPPAIFGRQGYRDVVGGVFDRPYPDLPQYPGLQPPPSARLRMRRQSGN